MENLSTAELKNDLHRLIVETDDTNFLEEIRIAFFNYQHKGQSIDWWDTIGEAGQKSIKKGMEQLEKGERIPHQEVRKEINEIIKNAKSSQR